MLLNLYKPEVGKIFTESKKSGHFELCVLERNNVVINRFLCRKASKSKWRICNYDGIVVLGRRCSSARTTLQCCICGVIAFQLRRNCKSRKIAFIQYFCKALTLNKIAKCSWSAYFEKNQECFEKQLFMGALCMIFNLHIWTICKRFAMLTLQWAG